MQSKVAQLALAASILLASTASAVAFNDEMLAPKSLALAGSQDLSLAQVGKTTSKSSSSKKNDDPYGIGSFFLGCFLIPFSLTLLWKNERKLVMFTKVVDQGRKAVKTVDADELDDANEFGLVHTTGSTLNETELVD